MSEVRRATLAELDALVELDAACFARPWRAAAWEPELRSESVFCLGTPFVGAACAPVILDTCELRRIAVHPAQRRRGIGRDLLAHVIHHARGLRCERIQLEVAAGNAAAIGLYRALGFEVVGRRPRYYDNPPDDALLLDLALG